jgi:hypothetical protein
VESLRGEIYLDRPNVLSYHRYLAQSERDELSLREGFDIVGWLLVKALGEPTAVLTMSGEAGSWLCDDD